MLGLPLTLYQHFGDPVPQPMARKKLGLLPNVPVVLFFGLVRKYKGLKVLLEALRRVVAVFPEIRLLVAGEFYEQKERYGEFLRALSLECHVRLEDRYIPQSEVADYFCAADVVVLPYLAGTQSGVLSIARHFERPCIVANVGGLAEISLESRLMVKPGDAEGLAEVLVRFFREGNAFNEATHRCRQNHTWDRFCAAICELVSRAPEVK